MAHEGAQPSGSMTRLLFGSLLALLLAAPAWAQAQRPAADRAFSVTVRYDDARHAEVRVQAPPRLLRQLGLTSVVIGTTDVPGEGMAIPLEPIRPGVLGGRGAAPARPEAQTVSLSMSDGSGVWIPVDEETGDVITGDAESLEDFIGSYGDGLSGVRFKAKIDDIKIKLGPLVIEIDITPKNDPKDPDENDPDENDPDDETPTENDPEDNDPEDDDPEDDNE